MTAAELVDASIAPGRYGLPFAESKHLAGMKSAVFDGETLYLSPAMYSLLHSETEDGLEHLLASIPVVVIPRFEFRDIPISYVNFQ